MDPSTIQPTADSFADPDINSDTTFNLDDIMQDLDTNVFDDIADIPTGELPDDVGIGDVDSDSSVSIYTPIIGSKDPKIPVAKIQPEQEGEIDPKLNTRAMMTILRAEINRKKIAGHHLDSMNSFYDIGIKQIATKVFTIEGRLRNLRDKTEEDQKIAEISYRVDINDIVLDEPSGVKYKSGKKHMLTPSMARIKSLTYACPLTITSATVTATAHFKDGSNKERKAHIKDYRIATVPCMVKSIKCNTHNLPRETLKELEEDPESPGGQFIIKGLEWTVDNLENITNNTFHVYKNMYMNELARGTFLSKPGDAFENSYQVILRYLNNGLITVEITTSKFDKFEIPYYLLFRALGMTRDYDIVNHIVYGVDIVGADTVTKSILDILAACFEADEGKFAPIRKSTVPTEIIQFIAMKITEGAANPQVAKKDIDIAKYLNNNILQIIDRYVFPHIGTSIDHRIKKLRFFGHLINKLLRVYLGELDPTDRDSYENKRIFAAGTSMAKTFKTDFNVAIVQAIKKRIPRDLRTTPFSQVQLDESVKAAIHGDDLERLLTQAIVTGNGKLTIRRTDITNRIASQTLYHKNDANVTSTLNQINTPNTTASKQNERADEMRRVHPTFIGYIDVSQSPDTGEKVGKVKQMACSASIVGASSSFILKRTLEDDPDIIPQDNVPPEMITLENLSKVFVNGDWIGCCRESHVVARKYRELRRRGAIHHQTTIVWKILTRELYFWTDFGRCSRPLVIVYNNIEEYNRRWRAGDHKVQFKQWIKLTRDHIIGLRNGKVTMESLMADRVIEYISPEEQENAFLALNINVLRANVNNLRYIYSHCDIDQAIFGMITLASPMANHSSSTRITYYTNHRKQSAGWHALNFPFRIDKNTCFQHYCERPLISSFSDSLTYPNGTNTIVALSLYGGYCQEDSVTVNQASIDCGAFNASYFNYEKTELEKGEQFGNPDAASTMDIKHDASYEHIVGGLIAKGTVAQKGDVLIVKTAKIQKPVDPQYQYMDRSIVYKKDEPVYIDKVIITRGDEDQPLAKVSYRANRPLTVGDKLASRMGNKGIVANFLSRANMMYTESGLKPDLIVNAQSIPSRMALNQLLECLIAKLAAIMGVHIDCTAFLEFSLDTVIKELEKHGVQYAGHQRVYNGITGEYQDCLIFMGVTTYQRLQKFVIDEHYATRTGPTSALTYQPLDGKNNDGGLRIGEMEKDVFCAHGTMRTLYGKFYDDSDGLDIPFCRICGDMAIVNEKLNIQKCIKCGDSADIVYVKSSRVANVAFKEFQAMNANIAVELTPHVFAKYE